jgi:hypothetical protein
VYRFKKDKINLLSKYRDLHREKYSIDKHGRVVNYADSYNKLNEYPVGYLDETILLIERFGKKEIQLYTYKHIIEFADYYQELLQKMPKKDIHGRDILLEDTRIWRQEGGILLPTFLHLVRTLSKLAEFFIYGTRFILFGLRDTKFAI